MTRHKRGKAKLIFGLCSLVLWGLSACGGGSSAGLSTVQEVGGKLDETMIASSVLGEVQLLEFGSRRSLDIEFPQGSEDDTYLLLLHADNIRSGDFTLLLQDGSTDADAGADNATLALQVEPVEPEATTNENPAHEMMRVLEDYFASGVEDEVVSSSLSALALDTSPAETRSFRVLNSLNSITAYDEIEGRLRYAGDNVLVYVDTEMDAESYLTDADIEAMAADFEAHSKPTTEELFGEESDIDNNGAITILMTPVLNRMCLSSGIVTGFFYPGDLFANSNSNPASNTGEYFYTLVPDPTGKFCRQLSVDFTMNNMLPGVFVHEFQHMISFNQHVFENKGSTEESWLNEGLSHLAEDLAGYGLENYSRANIFLRQPTTTLIPSGLPSLAQRGASYLFLRYLYEQAAKPEVFLNSLLNTSLRGVANIEAALTAGETGLKNFSEALSYWQLALMLTDTDLSDDARLNYEPLTTDPRTGNPQGICLRCRANDGRGTVLTGPSLTAAENFPISVSLSSAGARFFQLNAPGSFLEISGSGDVELGGALLRLESKN